MARITVEDCLEKVPNRFTLVLSVVERTKQLMKGATARIDDDRANKEIVKALREIARYGVPDELTRFDENENVRDQRIGTRKLSAMDDLPPSPDDLTPETR